MIAALFLYRFVDGQRLGRILKMAPEKREAFAEATGVNYRWARIQVFMISSVALGFIGGFYATHFRGVSPNLFSFDTVLLSLAMLVIGGRGGRHVDRGLHRPRADRLGSVALRADRPAHARRRPFPPGRHVRHQTPVPDLEE